MKRLIACLVLCASLSASAQDDNCTILGIQDLTLLVLQLQSQIDSLETTSNDLQTQISTLQNTLTDLGSVQECVDENDNAICDFAELCLEGVHINFNYGPTGQESASCLSPGGSYPQALLSGADLSNANLQQVNLDNANLSEANLSGADLSFANLSDANLFLANLYNANLSDANLSGADLSSANLQGADLFGANLWNAVLVFANLSDAILNNADLSNASLFGATMTCLYGCPSALPSGYICEADPYCSNRYRIVPE